MSFTIDNRLDASCTEFTSFRLFSLYFLAQVPSSTPGQPPSTEVTYLVQSDIKGNVPTSVVNTVAQQQAFMVAALRKELVRLRLFDSISVHWVIAPARPARAPLFFIAIARNLNLAPSPTVFFCLFLLTPHFLFFSFSSALFSSIPP